MKDKNIIERWITAKAAVRNQVERIQGEIDKFASEFTKKTGQEVGNCYQPFFPAERSGHYWQPAERGRPVLHATTLHFGVSNGNTGSVSENHWDISLKQAERLAIDLAGVKNEEIPSLMEGLATFEGKN